MTCHICSKCEQECETITKDVGGVEEFWGRPVWHEQLEDASECCGEDTYTDEEWRENGWDTPKGWLEVDLQEHGFIEIH